MLAGGQSLIPLLSMRLAAPATLVDINRVPGLDTVEATGDGVRVGALVRHNQLLHDDAAARVQPLLARATANVAHPAIRNRGTTVGSIAHADPAGEMTSVLALTDGSVDRRDALRDVRRPLADLFVGPLETSLHGPAVVTSAFFPALPAALGHRVRRGRPPQGRLRRLRRRRRRHARRGPPRQRRPGVVRLGRPGAARCTT